MSFQDQRKKDKELEMNTQASAMAKGGKVIDLGMAQLHINESPCDNVVVSHGVFSTTKEETLQIHLTKKKTTDFIPGARDNDDKFNKQKNVAVKEEVEPFVTASSTLSLHDDKVCNIVFEGIIGTDEKGNTYCPQKLTYAYDESNTTHATSVKKIIDESVLEWNSKEGCKCTPFSFTLHNWKGEPPNVLSGLTHGFKRKIIPDEQKNEPKKEDGKKEEQKKGAKKGQKKEEDADAGNAPVDDGPKNGDVDGAK